MIHTSELLKLSEDARSRIKEISVAETRKKVKTAQCRIVMNGNWSVVEEPFIN